jgi:hypothetical protein
MALADLKLRAEALDDKENDLIHQLRGVRLSKRTVQAEIAELTNNTAPIACLPNELLIVIFEKLRPLARTSSQKRNFPLDLCHVTRRWRSVVVGTSSLWTSIELSSESTDLLDAHLERSRGCQLEIIYDDVEEGPYNVRTRRNLDQVTPHIERVRQLRIFSESLESIHLILFRLSRSDALVLEHISIVCLDALDEGEVDLYNASHPGSAPSLTSLDLTGNIALAFLPSLNTVTTLKLRDLVTDISPKYRRLFEMLGALTNLTSLSLHGRVVHYGLAERLPKIEIASLLHLSISLEEDPYDEEDESFFPPDYLACVCTALITPSLETLALHHTTQHMFSYFASSLPVQPCRYPALKTLEISDRVPADGSVINITQATIHLIQALPTITHLAFLNGCAADVVELLIDNTLELPATSTLYWPALEVVTIMEMDTLRAGNILRQFVSGRDTRASPLSKLRLRASRSGKYTFASLDDVKWLQERLELEPIFEEDTYHTL